MTPKLRFKEFTHEWQDKKLGEVAKIERGRFSPRPRNDPRYYGGNIPFVQTGDVTRSGGIVSNYSQTLNQGGLKVSRLFPKGTILITIAANIGYTGILKIDMACPDSLIGISCKKDLIDNRFLNYYLATQREHIDRIASEAAQKNINIEFLKPYKIPFTNLAEQEKIAGFLTAIDEKISYLEAKRTQLEKYRKGVMQEIFSQIIRFKETDNSGFPDWKEKKLGEVGNIITGATPPTVNKEYYGGSFPWVTPTDISSDKDIYASARLLTRQGIEKGRFVPKNSLLATCIASIGKNAILRVDGSCNQQINAISPDDRNSVDFLYYLLEKNKNTLIKFAGAGGMQMLNKNDFSNIKFKTPILLEQQKISDFLTSIDKLIESEQQQITQAEQWKNGLMQQMFV